MLEALSRMWTSRWAAPTVLAVAVTGGVAASRYADLSPEVEPEFFFAEDDPRVRASLGGSTGDGLGSQPIIVRVEDLAGDEDAYERRVAELTSELRGIKGVRGAYSITTEDARRSPMFSRLLLTRDPAATNVVLDTFNPDPEAFMVGLEAVMAEHVGPDLSIVASGVPVIMELIRRNLLRDLIVFSGAAALIFALLVWLIYRDPAILLGTLTTCALSVSATLMAVQALDVSIGLLTANIVTITFVLTLSHVVFMTANWGRASRGARANVVDGPQPAPDNRLSGAAVLSRGIGDTLEGSFWAMATTLAGFLSLLFASAKPLEELGTAGAVAAVLAMLVAYGVYPAFLGRWAKPREVEWPVPGASAWLRRFRRMLGGGSRVRGRWIVFPVAVGAVAGAMGVTKLNTDPGLLAYFATGGGIRAGLGSIDHDGGSSTLDLTVQSADGRRLDEEEVFERLEELQDSLEADSVVGVVLSPTTMVGHARTLPFARLIPLPTLIDLALDSDLGAQGAAYLSDDRIAGRYYMRMRESMAGEPREAVMDRVQGYAVSAGLNPTRIGGLYHLQAELGQLIASSLRTGIGALLAFFLLVGIAVSRVLLTTLRMWLCLAAIPLIVLGTFGHLGIAVDIITSPASNVALALGVDSIIHLVVRERRLRRAGEDSSWRAALSQIGPPVLGASSIICVGFGIFALSTFPPTGRFGLAVVLGTVVAASMALAVLPRWAGAGGSSRGGPRGFAEPA